MTLIGSFFIIIWLEHLFAIILFCYFALTHSWHTWFELIVATVVHLSLWSLFLQLSILSFILMFANLTIITIWHISVVLTFTYCWNVI